MFKKIGYFIFLWIIMTGGILMTSNSSAQSGIYHYGVNAGGATGYDLYYGADDNYLTDEQGRPMLRFTVIGTADNAWAQGVQATSASERNPLAYGIKVFWFSPFENQFWMGQYAFPREFMEQLKSYRVNELFTKSSEAFLLHFKYRVFVLPSGIATVWISGQGDIHLLGQFQAEAIEIDDWDRFSRILGTLKPVSREELIKRRLSHRPEEFQKQYREGTLS
ncbi:MAG: DUF2931 family protein, partial [Saezia sp.]